MEGGGRRRVQVRERGGLHGGRDVEEARRWVHGSGFVEGADHGGPEGCVRIGGG